MEEQVFPRSAVADLLEEGFIEGRLHIENQRERTEAQFQAFLELRDQHVGTQAIPAYVVIEPKSKESLAFYQLPGADPDVWEQDFVRILGAARAQHPARVDVPK